MTRSHDKGKNELPVIRYIRSKEKDRATLAIHVSGPWRSGLKFYSEDTEFLQVGTWCYSAGRVLAAHRHDLAEREITHTQEVVYVRCGAVRAIVYDYDGSMVDHFEMHAGDFAVMLNGGHGYEIMENDTQVLEVKNGPYVGAEKDRTRL